MKIWVHLLTSSILALAFYPVFNWKVLFILVGGVLIDFDHYLWYIYKFRKYSLRASYKFYSIEAAKTDFEIVKGILLLFHTIEFLLIAIIFSFYFDFALVFTIGLSFHLILDIIHRYSIAETFITNPSIISWILKNKIQKH